MGNGDTISAKDMRQWLQEEVRRVMKVAELQVRDATDFVTAYSSGELSAEQAMGRMMQYDTRWGEGVLLAAMPDENTPNEQISRSSN